MPQLTKLKRKYNLTRFNRTSASLGERRGSISEADPQINMLLLGWLELKSEINEAEYKVEHYFIFI